MFGWISYIYILVTVSLSQSLISCRTDYSAFYSGSGDDDVSMSGCYANETMLSCGYYSKSSNRDGGYIENEFCVARNGNGGANTGAKPYARCCNISGGITCRNVDLTFNNPSDDTQINIHCDSDEILTGCTVHSFFNSFDGIKPKSTDWIEYCELYTSSSTVRGQARCCKLNDNDLEMTCITREATNTDPTKNYVLVECEPYETMTGCSGKQLYNGLLLSNIYIYVI